MTAASPRMLQISQVPHRAWIPIITPRPAPLPSFPRPPPPTSQYPKPMSASSSSHMHLSYPSSQQVQETLPSQAFPEQPVSLSLLLQPHIPSQYVLWLNYFPGLPMVLPVVTPVRLQSHLHPAQNDHVCVLVTQSCPTLCDPVDCSPPGSSVHGIVQARILECVAISFSRGSSQTRD